MRWDVYERYFLQLNPVLQEMTRTGVCVDTGMVETQIQRLEQLLDTSLPPPLPREVLQTQVWKRPPTDVTDPRFREIRIPATVKRCTACGEDVSNKSLHYKGGKKNPCTAAGGALVKVEGTVTGWEEALPFNPQSPQQVARYATHFNHRARLNPDTKRPTYDDTQLEMWERKYGQTHPLYGWILYQRKHRKALGTFFEPLRGRDWVTGTFTHNPESARLSMQSLNFQQFSKSGEVAFAKELRHCIIPRPGHLFVGADSSAIEAVMTAWYADDPTYMDIALQGIHAFLSCSELGLAFTPENVSLVKHAHKKVYNRKKRTVHGSAYGMTPPMLAQNYPEAFPSVADAKREQDLYFALCPALTSWWDRIRDLASLQGYLENAWGYRNYFWKVFQRDTVGNVALGPDGKSVISFLPQSSAAFWMRRCLIEIARRRHASWRIPAIGAIHDGYILEVPSRDADDAEAMLLDILTAPIPEMNGLRIGAEADRGDRWGTMDTTRAIPGKAPSR